MNIANCPGYTLIEKRDLPDMDSVGYLLQHTKSGARFFVMENDDENKVFSIAFRTPPIDSTGLTHILEHSVLCGSKKFPVKDPFVELAKGSLNTFLNAMTYPDKTVYPVASLNDKDFQNLIDVYLDAVFYPNIYKREEIFKQEGWHYELTDPEGELTLNGVVYNEMKGAFSSADDVVAREIMNSLYPDTAYGFESGGDPDVIPELSYESFLRFHADYYHPSNSYVFLYGDADMEEKLNWMDRAYFSDFDQKAIDTELKMQTPFDAVRESEKYYPVTAEEGEQKNTYLTYNISIGTVLDPELYVALEVMEYAMLSASGAPLKQRLLDAGIGMDVVSYVDNGILQPFFSIIAKNAEASQKEEFLRIIREYFDETVKNGFVKKSLLAAISSFEFKYREADSGRFPIGLSYGLQCMDSWLYDDKDPFMHLQENGVFHLLREGVDTGYFEDLLQKYFVENTHASVLTVMPKIGLNRENEQALKDKLAAYKAGLSKKEIKALIKDTAHLKAYQEEPSTKKELKTIPLLNVSDIKKECAHYLLREESHDGISYCFHDYSSNGIGYLNLMFDADWVKEEDLCHLSLLSSVLGYVDTASYGFDDLANEVCIHTGGLGGSVFVGVKDAGKGDPVVYFTFKAKMLYPEVEKAFDLIREILVTSKMRDPKRLREIVSQLKSRSSSSITGTGHSIAFLRGVSYFSESGRIVEKISGVDYYRFIEDLEAHFDERYEECVSKMEELCKQLFVKEHFLVSFVGKDFGDERLYACVDRLRESLAEGVVHDTKRVLSLARINEGFKTSAKINYVARCGNFYQHGLPYTGRLRVLKTILSYDYMWLNVRVKGGAYGCMSGFDRSGDSYFVSYRDPNLAKTKEVFDGITDYVAHFDADERDMTKFIIGTMSTVDTPKNAAAKGASAISCYITGVTEEMRQKERDAILSTRTEDIRALAPYMEAVLKDDYICVVGNETMIEEAKDLFDHTDILV